LNCGHVIVLAKQLYGLESLISTHSIRTDFLIYQLHIHDASETFNIIC